MGVDAILDSVQYVVDKDGQQTAVLLDLPTWDAVRQLLEDLGEDERLAKLLDEVAGDEKLTGEAAWDFLKSDAEKR
jgi:hypothetical protein